MRLSELLTPSRIRIPLRARDKEGVLRELVELILPEDGGTAGGGGPGQAEEVLGAILERERQFPTGIGYGVAVPHGKTPALSTLGVVAGTTVDPVAYETGDGEPVRIFFMLAGPGALSGAHVKGLSRISRLVGGEPNRGRLLNARPPEEVYPGAGGAEGGQ